MEEITLMAVGDISLQTKDITPFKYVKETFKNKDILFGNLETVLSNSGKKAKKAIVLRSSPEHSKYLKDVDFDVLNIANNHILDLGLEGFNNTLNTLNEEKIAFIGANNNGFTIIKRKDLKFGFLGYVRGHFRVPRDITINKLKKKKILTDIESIKDQCDFIVVSLHWGTENIFYPSPKQINLAHKIIDHGATLVVGHHPHTIQGIEKYKNGLIAYSLGNFQFDPKASQTKTNESIILGVNFTKDGIKSYEIIPVVIDRDLSPTIARGQIKRKIIDFISAISKSASSGKVTNKWWFEEIAEEYLINNMNSYIVRIKRYGILPALECCVWLVTPFCIRCYAGIIRRKLRERSKR